MNFENIEIVEAYVNSRTNLVQFTKKLNIQDNGETTLQDLKFFHYSYWLIFNKDSAQD